MNETTLNYFLRYHLLFEWLWQKYCIAFLYVSIQDIYFFMFPHKIFTSCPSLQGISTNEAVVDARGYLTVSTCAFRLNFAPTCWRIESLDSQVGFSPLYNINITHSFLFSSPCSSICIAQGIISLWCATSACVTIVVTKELTYFRLLYRLIR